MKIEVFEAVLTLILISILYLSIILVRWRICEKKVEDNLSEFINNKLQSPDIIFKQSMVSALPEPVQRYFNFCIKSGTPLYRSAEFDMRGSFSFNSNKAYQQLSARQIICAPEGMIWKANIGTGISAVSGSDGVLFKKSWTQFALYNLFPVAQIGDNKDHYQSAVGRMLAETVFWTPGALLVSLQVHWETPEENTIRALIKHSHFNTAIDIKLEANGCPIEVCFQRWSNANNEKVYKYQSFGGFLSNFKEYDGITIPTHIEAGNLFGTDDFFPFYKVDIQNLQWLG